jgi:AraC family transcriptional regulator of adaptative response/methylated-DNA-[protein]-cysteine methyltransferase
MCAATEQTLTLLGSPDDNEHWTAVLRRDRQADGEFSYAVRTTGVYCRPSCASRPPRPENVSLHETCDDAERAGFRHCGDGAVIRFAVAECSLGWILVGATSQGVCAILLGSDPDVLVRDLQDRFPAARLSGGDADFDRLVAMVVGLVENPERGLGLPLDVRGTAFQQRVWQALCGIPAGSTMSYADIARQVGAPRAVRAVAQACASNPIAVAIPCHRVVRRDGSLSGYRWGVERKRLLLEREAAS